jgi:hypothetical protein
MTTHVGQVAAGRMWGGTDQHSGRHVPTMTSHAARLALWCVGEGP